MRTKCTNNVRRNVVRLSFSVLFRAVLIIAPLLVIPTTQADGLGDPFVAAAVMATSTKPPPAPRVEQRPPPPGRDFLWSQGYWEWHRQRAEWHPGHWEAQRPGLCYAQPTWRQVPNGFELRGGWINCNY